MRSLGLKFSLRVLAWLIPCAVLWLALTGFYNVFLRHAAGNLLKLVESPNVSQLLPHERDEHYIVIVRTDFPPARARTGTVRVTDIHFHLVLLGALFLAVPGVSWRRRLTSLGWAALVTVAFDVVLLFFWVKFTYATQLGAWSAENYGTLSQIFFGMGKHTLDLPFKLGLPLALFVAFFYREILPRRPGA